MAQISASVAPETVIEISRIAKEEKRSFSEMVNILLTEYVWIRAQRIPKSNKQPSKK